MSITWFVDIAIAVCVLALVFAAFCAGRGIGHIEGRREGIADAKIWRQPR